MQIVWFSEIKWDYLRTRKHQIISRKPRDIELLYLEPYVRGRRNDFSLRREHDFHAATVPFVKSPPKGIVRTLLNPYPSRWMVSRCATMRVRSLARRLGFEREATGVVISNIYAIDSALRIPGRFLLYDCNDAHDAFPGMPAWTGDYFTRTCRHADGIFASSRELVKKTSSVRGAGTCVYLGNGVEYERFAVGEEALEERGRRPGVKIGYVGAIAPWLDFELLLHLSRSRPEWEVLLTGPVLMGVERSLEELTSLPNVHRLEPVPYEKVPEILRELTVGVIPFLRTRLTRSVNPNKLYEYLAAGLPVVATDFSEELVAGGEVVFKARDREEFLAFCETAVSRVSTPAAARELGMAAQAVARENDWNRIAERFWRGVRMLMEGGGLGDFRT